MALRLPHRQVCDGASSAVPVLKSGPRGCHRLATPFAHSAAQISAAPASAVNSELSRPGSTGKCTTRPGQGGPPPKAHAYAGVGGRFHSGHKATLHLHKCSHSLLSPSGHVVLGKAHGSLRKCFRSPAATAGVCSAPLPGHTAWPSTGGRSMDQHCHGTRGVTAGAQEGSGPASPAVSPPGPSHTSLPSPSPVHLCGQLRLEVLGAHSMWHWSAGSEGHF